jgi:hypothetical protein
MRSAFDVILGDAWLKAMDATLHFKSNTCVVAGEGSRAVELHMSTAEPTSNQTHTLPAVLSCTQAKWLCKYDEFWHCCIVFKPAPAAADTAFNAAAVEQLGDLRVQRLQQERLPDSVGCSAPVHIMLQIQKGS